MSIFKKNTAVTGFPFSLVNKTTGAAVTTGTPTIYYLLDGGTQGTVAGASVHEGNGQWSVNLTAGEMNGDVVGLFITHADVVPYNITIRTQSGLISDVQSDILSAHSITTNTIVSHLTDIKGATFSGATDSLEAIRDRGDAAWVTGGGGANPILLQNTTIATLASQTSFTLTAGSADNDAYNKSLIIVTDAVTSAQKCVGVILDYVGATKTVTLESDPGVFTMAVGDTADIIAAELTTINVGTDNKILISADAHTAGATVAAVTGAVGSVASGVTVTTNNDKSGYTASTVTDKTGYSISGTKTTLDALNDVTSASVADAVWDEARSGHVSSGSFGEGVASVQGGVTGSVASVVGAVGSVAGHTPQTGDTYALANGANGFASITQDIQSRIGTAGAGLTALPWNPAWDAEVQSECTDALNAYDPPTKAEMDALLTTQLTEGYAVDGVAPTLTQAIFAIQQMLAERSIAGTTLTIKKLDGTTTAMTFTLDSATAPTTQTRAT